MGKKYIIELEPHGAWFCTSATLGRTGTADSATRFDSLDLAEFALNLSKLLARYNDAKIIEVAE